MEDKDKPSSQRGFTIGDIQEEKTSQEDESVASGDKTP